MGESVRLNDDLRLESTSATTPASDEKIRELHESGRLMTFREWASSLGFSHKTRRPG